LTSTWRKNNGLSLFPSPKKQNAENKTHEKNIKDTLLDTIPHGLKIRTNTDLLKKAEASNGSAIPILI
jgi:hypothetical protein